MAFDYFENNYNIIQKLKRLNLHNMILITSEIIKIKEINKNLAVVIG